VNFTRCPKCGFPLSRGFKEAYARKQDGSVITILLWVDKCENCGYIHKEDYDDKIERLGLKPY